MDIDLPGISGLEAANLFRVRSPGTAVVMLTLHDTPAHRQAAATAGATAYVTKGGPRGHARTDPRGPARIAREEAGMSATRDGLHFYSPESESRASRRQDLESGLRRALARGEFVVHYQPQTRLADGATTSVEALIRWNSPSWAGCRRRSFITARRRDRAHRADRRVGAGDRGGPGAGLAGRRAARAEDVRQRVRAAG